MGNMVSRKPQRWAPPKTVDVDEELKPCIFPSPQIQRSFRDNEQVDFVFVRGVKSEADLKSELIWLNEQPPGDFASFVAHEKQQAETRRLFSSVTFVFSDEESSDNEGDNNGDSTTTEFFTPFEWSAKEAYKQHVTSKEVTSVPASAASSSTSKPPYSKQKTLRKLRHLVVPKQPPPTTPCPQVSPKPPPETPSVVEIRTYENECLAMVEQVVEENRLLLKCATIELLVEKLADEQSQDQDLVLAFLLTYRKFLRPNALLMLLLQRFVLKPPTKPTKEELTSYSTWAWQIQFRILNVLQCWLQNYWHFDFEGDQEMQRLLEKFFNKIEQQSRSRIQMQEYLQQLQRTTKNQKMMMMTNDVTLNPDLDITSSPSDFLKLETTSIARQLTLIDFNYFRKVKPLDLISFIWPEPNQKEDDPVKEYAVYFTTINYWVSTEITAVPVLSQRVEVLTKMIQLMSILRGFNNLNATMAMYVGLNQAAVQRLKRTWEALSPVIQAKYAVIEKELTPQDNYGQYRQLELKEYPQFIPFFGLLCKDLTFANDGNPLHFDGLANVDKLRSLSLYIRRVTIFQKTGYPFPVEPSVYHYCSHLSTPLDDDALYKYSLLAEPRQASEPVAPKSKALEGKMADVFRKLRK
eukprot:Lithocolla_globosa_v1_NODE_576_length_3702_cov_18.492185.p1 type:complete len:635 gc:universal NODE_576_length_3702_cov_18.492185:2531-627(-)